MSVGFELHKMTPFEVLFGVKKWENFSFISKGYDSFECLTCMIIFCATYHLCFKNMFESNTRIEK